MAQKTTTERSGHVLVVDDDQNVRRSIADVLRVSGYLACEGEDSEHVLALLAKGDVSLVLLDFGLPSGKGLELLHRIEDPPPVILMSGSGEAPVVDPRVSAFLSKPFQPARLLEEVALCLKRS